MTKWKWVLAICGALSFLYLLNLINEKPPSKKNDAPSLYGINGDWILQWNIGQILYKGRLIMKGTFGKMKIEYFDVNISRNVYVDHDIQLFNSPQGIYLKSSYNIIFLLQKQYDGSIKIVQLCFQHGECLPVYSELVNK